MDTEEGRLKDKKGIKVPIELVHWEDTASIEGWVRGMGVMQLRDEHYLIPQVGFALGGDEGHLYLTNGFGDSQLMNIYKIPEGTVHSRKKLGHIWLPETWVDEAFQV